MRIALFVKNRTGLFKQVNKPNCYEYNLYYQDDIIRNFQEVELIGKQIF